jgi:hypothetical protein
VKIRGTCQICGRDFLVQQVLDSGGHCWNCGNPYQAQYTAVLAEALEVAERAGGALEAALERIAGVRPMLVLDGETVLAGVQASLAALRERAESLPRHEHAAERV